MTKAERTVGGGSQTPGLDNAASCISPSFLLSPEVLEVHVCTDYLVITTTCVCKKDSSTNSIASVPLKILDSTLHYWTFLIFHVSPCCIEKVSLCIAECHISHCYSALGIPLSISECILPVLWLVVPFLCVLDCFVCCEGGRCCVECNAYWCCVL